MLRPNKMYQGKTSLYFRHYHKSSKQATLLQKFKAILRGTIV